MGSINEPGNRDYDASSIYKAVNAVASKDELQKSAVRHALWFLTYALVALTNVIAFAWATYADVVASPAFAFIWGMVTTACAGRAISRAGKCTFAQRAYQHGLH